MSPNLTPLLRKLKRIGRSLNQAAAKANSGVGFVPSLMDALAGQQMI